MAIAFSIPRSTSYVSTSRTQLFGIVSAKAPKASGSESNACTQLWAWVPRTGMPKR